MAPGAGTAATADTGAPRETGACDEPPAAVGGMTTDQILFGMRASSFPLELEVPFASPRAGDEEDRAAAAHASDGRRAALRNIRKRTGELPMPSRIAAELAHKWNIPVAVGPGTLRYSERGNWYHSLRAFPGALVDATGFVVFETERDWRECPQLAIGPKGDVGVRGGISQVYGYRRVEPS